LFNSFLRPHLTNLTRSKKNVPIIFRLCHRNKSYI
jgi:hypothetical protein